MGSFSSNDNLYIKYEYMYEKMFEINNPQW